MISKTVRKLAHIRQSVRNEGLQQYLRRLYNLGQYRRYLKLALYGFKLGQKKAFIEGIPLCLPARKAGITEELILYGVHEPFATTVYKGILRSGDTILDVGTNIGYYLAVADSTLSGQCILHGFEADPELAQIAAINCKHLQARCSINHTAIADQCGLATFFVSDVSNWGTLRKRDELCLSGEVQVKTTTIDSYCEEYGVIPTVIRMDIEGGEILALRGARQSLKQVRVVFLELHCAFLDDEELAEIIDILATAGIGRGLWFSRYYDWPWSRTEAAKSTASRGSIEELKADVCAKKYKVMTVFAIRN